ncbi:hypothetical protein M9Y10_011448 [Tritrichomonas musculus]|uniref:Protein kinase domain-containing protein n=1 Tax=Tritrichomonas musculus TaxID=1915356 RepID=A0ABR2IKS8_9EUKA
MSEVDELTGVFVEADTFEEDENDGDVFEGAEESAPSRFVLAKDTSTNENVICKVFNPKILKKGSVEGSNDKKDQAWYKQLMLMREVIFLKELVHPAIVGFKGFNIYNDSICFIKKEEEEEDDDDDDDDDEEPEEDEEKSAPSPTIFLEYLQNKSLDNAIKTKHKLTPVKRQICMIGLASAVRYLHSKKIIHRCLNPRTIWLDSDDYPKLFDFSTSRASDPENDINKTQINNDSIYYQDPTIAENPKYDNPIDIYALGRLLYYFATGSEPFKLQGDPLKNKGPFFVQERISKDNAFPLFPDSLTPQLKELLIRCWDSTPNDRPIAAEIYYHLTQEKEYLLTEVKSEDLPEIDRYIDMIETFESEHKSSKLEIEESFSFHVRLTADDASDVDYDEVPDKKPQQLQMLSTIISTNFAMINPEVILKLLIKMAENETIYQEDYLPQVINFVNDLSSKGDKLANSFLEKVFGEYVFSSRGTTEIKMNSINKSIKYANIPPWVTKIGKHAFSGYKDLIRVNIPNSVKVIDDEAFSACPKLTFVNIPESIEKENLGQGTFKGCSSLKYAKLPSKLTLLKDSTFKENKSLSSIILNHDLKTIGKEAFDGCESLGYVEIPASVKLISSKAFHHCKNLKNIFFRGQRPKIEKKAISWRTNKLP